MGFDKSVTAIISRNGDLISDCWLEVVLKKSGGPNTTFYPAEALLSEIKLEIGGQLIDRHYADWLRVHDGLFRSNEEKEQYRRLVDFVDNEPANTIKRFYVPLVFFFNTQPGLALPLIALTAGRKSTQPCATGLCARENLLGSQTFSQVLVAC